MARIGQLASARAAALAHPAGVALLAAAGAEGRRALRPAARGRQRHHHCCQGHAALGLFGPGGYGQRQGWITLPAQIAQGAAPFAFALLVGAMGPAALAITAGLGLAAFAALMALRPPEGDSRSTPT